jgi:hypothetical protein
MFIVRWSAQLPDAGVVVRFIVSLAQRCHPYQAERSSILKGLALVRRKERSIYVPKCDAFTSTSVRSRPRWRRLVKQPRPATAENRPNRPV